MTGSASPLTVKSGLATAVRIIAEFIRRQSKIGVSARIVGLNGILPSQGAWVT